LIHLWDPEPRASPASEQVGALWEWRSKKPTLSSVDRELKVKSLTHCRLGDNKMTTIKERLAQKNYADVLKQIQAVERGSKRKGTGTRRDWWEVLAGNQNGSSKTIEGRSFPVLSAARRRKGWPVTKECLCRDANEEAPSVVPQIRWEKCKTHSHDLVERTI
jgi:hypothetical protein